MKLVITGATGYIGSRLTSLAVKRGCDVVAATRNHISSPSASWIHFDLANTDIFSFPVGTDVTIHLAANTTASDALEDFREFDAAIMLIKAAKNAGVKLVFVSSQTARFDAPTNYGRTKWRIEQEVLLAGGIVVRPGQVYGGPLRGLYGALVKAVQQLPLLPHFIPSPQVQPIHVDDLVEGLLRIAESSEVQPGTYCLASSTPVSFSGFLNEIAKSRLRCRRAFIPVPIIAIKFAAALLAPTWQAKFGLIRLSSLFNLPLMRTTSDLSRIGLTLRPLEMGLHRSGDGRRRLLLQEGRALLTYILKDQPRCSMLSRYVRAVEELRGEVKFRLPELFLKMPRFLSLLTKASWSDEVWGEEYIWRVDAASLIAEASPAGAVRFLSAGQRSGQLSSVLLIANAIVGEAFWRILSRVTSPLVRIITSNTK